MFVTSLNTHQNVWFYGSPHCRTGKGNMTPGEWKFNIKNNHDINLRISTIRFQTIRTSLHFECGSTSPKIRETIETNLHSFPILQWKPENYGMNGVCVPPFSWEMWKDFVICIRKKNVNPLVYFLIKMSLQVKITIL